MITKTLTSLRSQNKNPIRVISSLVIAIGMIFSAIMPFVDYEVKAEGGTYLPIDANVRTEIGNAASGTSPTYFIADEDVRAVGAYYENTWTIFFVSLTSFKRYTGSSDSSLPTSSASRYQASDDTYFWCSNFKPIIADPSIPFLNEPTGDSINAIRQLAYRYTYGDRAVDPADPWVYGEIKDLTYSTSIIGSGGGSGEANKDTISWYPFADSNQKMYGGQGVVDLRVVPGDYISGTQEGLLAQQYTDFILDVASAGHLATVQAYKGSYTVTWGEVMNKLSLAWPALQLIWDGSYWTKIGWVYQARYHSEDAPEDSWSEWQTVYTITSSSPTGTNGLDPSDGTALPGFYENVVDSFNTTSIVNNNVNNIYYVNNIPILTNEDEDPDEDPTDYNPILKEMRDILLQIRYMMMNINNAGDEDDPEDTGLKDADDELHRQEELLINDMDDKLGDIDTDVELLNDNGFLSAANWVRVQYDRITLNSPFELLIVFSLVLGIALIFIGKVR